MGSSAPPTPSGNTYVKKIEYDMDDDGNRDSVVTTVYGQQPTSVAYTSNSLNQYTAVGGATQTHDDNGNLTNDGTYKFKYDYRNQLCEVRLVADDSLVATYKHDPLGRRVEKDRASGTDERYVYAGVETIQVCDLAGNLKQAFVFGEGIDEVLMLQQADVLDFDSDSNTSEGTRSFYHRNALGSVMTVTDMNQAVVEDIRYDPYGAATITRNGQGQSSDPLGQHWAFTARFLDEETGLMYYRARMYDPGTGRFLQRDPLVAAGVMPAYEYCSSCPIDRADPLGLDDGPRPGTSTEADPSALPKPEYIAPSRNSLYATVAARAIHRRSMYFWVDDFDHGEWVMSEIEVTNKGWDEDGRLVLNEQRHVVEYWRLGRQGGLGGRTVCPDTHRDGISIGAFRNGTWVFIDPGGPGAEGQMSKPVCRVEITVKISLTQGLLKDKRANNEPARDNYHLGSAVKGPAGHLAPYTYVSESGKIYKPEEEYLDFNAGRNPTSHWKYVITADWCGKPWTPNNWKKGCKGGDVTSDGPPTRPTPETTP
jgi:RHS repeat-associated protein